MSNGLSTKLSSMAREERLEAAGICRECGQAPRAEGRQRCRPCLDRDLARRKARSRAAGGSARVMHCGLCREQGHMRVRCPTRGAA